MTDQRYFTLLTDKGKYKIAKAAADKGEVKFSHFAIGDGNGQETSPLPSQTGLVHEVWRGQLDSVTTDSKNPAAVIINAIIPHNVGGWWMREFGLFDADGDMLAVVKPSPNYKATSAEGQLEDVFYEFQLVIGEQAQVVVLVDPSILWATREYVETRRIPAQQLANTPWLPVKALDVATPPATNSQGDTYVVPTPAKGEWKDKSGQLAEWNGKSWTYFQTPDGHGIGLPAGSVYVKSNGQYQLLRQLHQNWFDLRYSQLIAPPSDTFYVVGPSGSDKNTGLKPTPEDGFATIQGAIDAISSRYITYGTITIMISPGTYDGFDISASLVQNWLLVGDAQNLTSYRILAKERANRAGIGCVAYAGHVTLRGLFFQTQSQCIAASGGAIDVFDCALNLPSGNSAFGIYGGKLSIYGRLTLTGACDIVFDVKNGSMVVGYKDKFVDNTAYINFSNCRSISVIGLTDGANAVFNPACCMFSGAISGRKYTISLNSTLQTYGSGANFLPGDSAGIITTGGQIS